MLEANDLILKQIDKYLAKQKRYFRPEKGEKPPKGAEVKIGPRAGKYYIPIDVERKKQLYEEGKYKNIVYLFQDLFENKDYWIKSLSNVIKLEVKDINDITSSWAELKTDDDKNRYFLHKYEGYVAKRKYRIPLRYKRSLPMGKPNYNRDRLELLGTVDTIWETKD